MYSATESTHFSWRRLSLTQSVYIQYGYVNRLVHIHLKVDENFSNIILDMSTGSIRWNRC